MKVQGRVTIPATEAKTGGSLKDFVWDRIVEGNVVKFEGDNVELLGTDAAIQPTFAELRAIVTAGGKFEGIKLGIEINNSSANTQVPVGLPGRTYTDEEGTEKVRTWIKYIDEYLQMERYNEGTRSLFKAGKLGSRLMNSDELAIIHSRTYANVIEWSEFAQRVKALTDEE